MKNIKVLIAEDDVLIAEHLKAILKKNGFFKIELAHKKKDIINKIINFKPNIALLDIRIDTEQTGIEIAQYISRNYNFPIIFITALSNKETLNNALRTNPCGYILKPFKAPEVIATIKIALNKHSSETDKNYLFIKDGHTDIRISQNQIFYIKSDKNYLEVYTKTQTYIVRKSLTEFITELNTPPFQRVHKSFVVNTDYVTELHSNFLIVNTFKIPVSRTYINDFKEYFFKNT